jgi:general stress protein YciG
MTELSKHQQIALAKKLEHGEDYYRIIGRAGGLKSRGGGFQQDRERARQAGKKGGLISGQNKRMRAKQNER